MEFNIKKNGTLPLLKMQVVDDGRGEFDSFMSFIETSSLYFSMMDVETGSYKIHLDPAGFVEKTQIEPNAKTEYYIYYKFPKKYTNKVGRYEGEFVLKNTDGTLILPIREKLYINVGESYGIEDADEFINLSLTAVISTGSTVVNYILTSDKPVKYVTTVNFTHTLQTLTGDSVVITTGVTINRGEKAGAVTITLPDVDYFNLTQETSFSNIQIFPIGVRAYTNITENVVFVLPPSQNITDAILTGIQNEYISVGNNFYLKFVDPQNITDAILADDGTYIKVGEGMYLRFIDALPITLTPTPTQTPTPTPTPTPVPPTPFISIWNADTTIELPYSPTGLYSGTIDWGDGNISDNTYENRTHTYNTTGDYTVTITGQIEGWNFSLYATSYQLNIKEILQWGPLRGENNSNEYMFNGCNNLVLTGVTDVIDLSGIQSMFSMFLSCQGITTVSNINSWNVSSVTNMSSMFFLASNFNQDIGSWDVSNVTDMGGMFYGASRFNQDIGGWDTSNVIFMNVMFNSASDFNQYIGGWNVSNVNNMNSMFYGAAAFNQDISGWNVSNVTNMGSMFRDAFAFNQNIGSWNVSNVNNMSNMFVQATNFNQNIGNWDVSKVTTMDGMFLLTTSFNQDIGNWNVSGVTNMDNMFLTSTQFNQDLSGWCVELILSEPTDFSTNASSWILPKPDWGTCPGPIPSPTPTPTNTETQTPTPTITPTPTLTPNCVRQIVVPTLWNGNTAINSNLLQLTETSETLQIQVNDIITDNIGATSFVGIVDSDGTYTYVYTGAGGGVAFPCQFPLTFSGNC
jgi:surface protein